MKIRRQIFLWVLATFLTGNGLAARERTGVNSPGGSPAGGDARQTLASCTPAFAKTDLDINNVRTTIMTGGDMWWDLANPKYEVPKGSGTHSVFGGSLWIGGLDAGGQLKVAAMTYRQNGNDFWPGPLDMSTVSTDAAVCNAYDKHWKVTRKEVEEFVSWYETGLPLNYTPPQSILTWPGNGDPSKNHDQFLAPFHDRDGDGIYNPSAGDYPGYVLSSLNNDCSKDQLFGDQTLWWVFNDKGSAHTETGSQAIGLELQAQAFAFTTNDEINNMTFYKYKIINRSTIALNDCYFGVWADSDLGYAFDDFVGCDVSRGLGYTYNGDANDGSSAAAQPGAYGANPPALGIDFFQGPLADAGDGIDNDRDGVVDEQGEQIIMSRFLYYNNSGSVQGDPQLATDYYNYLIGLWRDGTPFTYGGNGYGGSQPCDFMFPGDSDPQGWGTNGQPQLPWDEASSNNQPGDRRFVQSAGAFTLAPGAVNYVTTGVVWARASSGGPAASVDLMRLTDDKAQALFDNCFQVLNGPDAPDVTIQEMNQELILFLSNKQGSNNEGENYTEVDPLIGILDPAGTLNLDETFDFEGYQVFQLKEATVTTADLYDPDKARLVVQCDVRNDVKQLVNFNFSPALNANVPQDMTLESNDAGIAHSFSIKSDAFATGDNRLINHKTYYYMVLAYGYNSYIPYKDDAPYNPADPLQPSVIGQKKPYKAGRKNIKVYAAIPHIPNPEAGGTAFSSSYGSGPKITRIEGNGNGGQVLDFDDKTVEAILNATPVDAGGTARADQPTYAYSRGPVNIKVIDPLNVAAGDFELRFINNAPLSTDPDNVREDTTRWMLTQTAPVQRSWTSEKLLNLGAANEQLIPELGISVAITQTYKTGNGTHPDKNGFMEATMTFGDQSKVWLTGVADQEGQNNFNWIRSGTVPAGTGCGLWAGDVIGPDDNGEYEKILGGTWAPYKMTAGDDPDGCFTGPRMTSTTASIIATLNRIETLASVDVVLTPDKSKWSRCVVIEAGSNAGLNEGATPKWHLRAGQSLDKNGNPDGTGTGMSWFPGYAINVETGERLNIAFAENSALVAENGRDMKWNPTASVESPLFDPLWGGMHYIYVFGHNGNVYYNGTNGPADLNGLRKNIPAYDGCQAIYKMLTSSQAFTGGNPSARDVVNDAMWVNIPLLTDNRFAFSDPSAMPCEAKVRIRMAKPYQKNYHPTIGTISATNVPDQAVQPQNNNDPLYRFSTYDLQTEKADHETAVNALELINVVPNPYYAYSGYEMNQLDNRVKITNLPEKCTVRIYTISGTQIRKITKDSPQTYMDWDLKNQAGVAIASGMYIIHVDVPGVGEKILKWFGVMRPIDLDSF